MPSSRQHAQRVLLHQESVLDLIEKIKDWNRKYPIGTDVVFTPHLGSAFHTTTRSAAQLLNARIPVIFLEGVSNCVALERVTPRCELMPVYAAREAE